MLSHLTYKTLPVFVLFTTIIFCLTLISFICPQATHSLLRLAVSFPPFQLSKLQLWVADVTKFLFLSLSAFAIFGSMVRRAAVLILSLQFEGTYFNA